MIKLILKWLILLALLCYIAIASIWAVDSASHDTIKEIIINIDQSRSPGRFVTKKGVMEKLNAIAGKLKTTPRSKLNIEKIERRLSADNSFEHVECYITADDNLHIDILPMIPEIRIINSNGKSYYINKAGKKIDTDKGFYLDVPIVRGDFDDDFPAHSILPVTRHIAADKEITDLITMVEVKNSDNILLYPCISGHVINIGDTTDLTNKFDNLLLFYRKVMDYKGWETYDTISVKFRNQVVATRRDKKAKQHSVVVADSTDFDELNLQGVELIESPGQSSTTTSHNNTKKQQSTPQ